MNLQCTESLSPLRVVMINPLSPAGHLIATKILSGGAFGRDQRVILTLLVFSNEERMAHNLKYELDSCAFPCTYSVEVSSNVPLITDADVFCFLTHLTNPNTPDFQNIESDAQFDTFYLLLKIASNLAYPSVDPDKITLKKLNMKAKLPKYRYNEKSKPVKPIIMADGLLALGIIRCAIRNLPQDLFFCPTPITATAQIVLGEHLKINRSLINDVLAWGIDDEHFHVEVECPVLRTDKAETGFCDWDGVSKQKQDEISYDHTQFNASWFKKDFVDKTKLLTSQNPYGPIYKASNYVNTLSRIWSARTGTGPKLLTLGVISDGSVGTAKGLPYVLPIEVCGDTFKVSTKFENDIHLKQEIRNFNQVAKHNHSKLYRHCKKFLEKNVKEMAFALGLESSTASTLTPSTGSLGIRVGSSWTTPAPVLEEGQSPYRPIKHICDFNNDQDDY